MHKAFHSIHILKIHIKKTPDHTTTISYLSLISHFPTTAHIVTDKVDHVTLVFLHVGLGLRFNCTTPGSC